MKRDQFIATARGYIGTRFHHQGRLPGVGLDCIGLVVCAARECGYQLTDVSGYSPVPSGGSFTQAVLAHCDVIAQDEVLLGDLMMFAFDSEPQHIAIVTEISADGTITLLHAYAQVLHVVENYLDATWQARLRGCYRPRGFA